MLNIIEGEDIIIEFTYKIQKKHIYDYEIKKITVWVPAINDWLELPMYNDKVFAAAVANIEKWCSQIEESLFDKAENEIAKIWG